MAYTTINDPSAYFQTVLWSGSGSGQAITNGGNSDLQPDFTWIKKRAGGSARSHQLYDSTRGTTELLHSNGTNAESTQAAGLTAFGSDGFTVGDDDGVDGSGGTYVAWQWKANGGTTSSVSASGTVLAGTYQANTTAGFSIITYTGEDDTVNTVTHGLGTVPHVIIVKGRSGSGRHWRVYHHKNTAAPETDFLKLNETDATADDVNYWYDTAPTSSVFSISTANDVNASTETYVAYCFAEKQGYSKFGSYVGNANADGAFVYTGFKPAFVMLKGYNHTGQWVMQDTTRRNYQGDTKYVYANLSNAEATNSALAMDFLSNGFKLRSADDAVNSGDYIYMAFAEQPFVTSTGVPATAR